MKKMDLTDEEFQARLLGEADCKEAAAVVHDLIFDHEKNWDQPTWGQIFTDKVNKITKRKPKQNKSNNYYGREAHAVAGCSTTGCVAGWVTQLAGDQMLVSANGMENLRMGYNVQAHDVITKDGEIWSIADRGQALLCLDSTWLFGGDRTLHEVLFALEELAEGKQPSQRSAYLLKMDGYKPKRLRPKPKLNKKLVQHTQASEAPKKATAKATVRNGDS